MDKKIKAIECIITWQGEVFSGIRMLLLRFKECNRVVNKTPCSYCDTLIKMKCSLESEFYIKDLQTTISDEKLGLMITGGEPTYGKNFDYTINLLNNLNYPVANIETNGYKIIGLIEKVNPNKNVKYIYSPKFFSMQELEYELEIVKLIHKNKNVFLKIVYQNALDDIFLNEIEKYNINHRIYLMPEGKNREMLINNSSIVFDAAEKYKVNFTSRDHIIFEFI